MRNRPIAARTPHGNGRQGDDDELGKEYSASSTGRLPPSHSTSTTKHRQRVLLGATSFALGCFMTHFLGSPLSSFTLSLSHSLLRNNNNDCLISFGPYRGHEYTTNRGATVGRPTCLVESKFLKIQQHTVRLPGRTDTISDWIWIDYHDRINVVVQITDGSQDNSNEPTVRVFEQSKYALEGRDSLALVGGMVEPGEKPDNAARREVEEETGLDCSDVHFLGRYRTDVNRGMGWTHTYLASKCQKHRPGQHVASDQKEGEEVGVADMEPQDVKTMTLSELRKGVTDGRFLEVQWTATVALAVLHLEEKAESLQHRRQPV